MINYKLQIKFQSLGQKGQALVFVLIILTLVLVNAILLANGSLTLFQNSSYSVEKVQATQLAEAAIDKAVASINQSGGSYGGETDTPLGGGTYSVTINTIDASTRLVQATAYIPNRTNPKAQKTVSIQLSRGTGVAFNYAVQVGEGGLHMAPNAAINGSVYSNGSITMNNNATITGDAFVAGGTQPVADQQSDCPAGFCTDFVFGRTANQQLDVAQSFIPSTNSVLNKVSLKLRKVGNPPNLNVLILADLGGPDRNRVIAQTTIPNNLVTTQYGWIDAVFSSPPNLLFTPYWIVLDTSADSNNYWMWSEDNNSLDYPTGQAFWSPNYNPNSGNPVWNNVNGDFGFRAYLGGVITSITGTSSSTIGHMNGLTRVGDAHADMLTGINVIHDIYYNQYATGVTYGGAAHPNSVDPPLQPYAISDANIADWKQQAIDAGVHNIGFMSDCPHTLAAGEYIGFISFPLNCNTTVGSPIHITDGMWMNGGDNITLDSSYGNSSGVIVSDGEISLLNNNHIQGSGTTGSFLVMLSTKDTRTDSTQAVSLRNNGNTGIFYAPYGTINISNNNSVNEIMGWQINMSNNVTITYDQGLANTFFSTGPSGSYSAVKGTYQSK